MRVVVIARAVRPLHGEGGLERSVHDLVRHLAARQVQVTLITPPPTSVRRSGTGDPFASPHITLRHVPYSTFPLANRRGTTILDRSTAYPLFGWRAGRVALELARTEGADIVHAFGASGLGYALCRRQTDPPLVVKMCIRDRFMARRSRSAGAGGADAGAAVRAARKDAKTRLRKRGPVYWATRGATGLMYLDVWLWGRFSSGPFFARLRKLPRAPH